MTDTLYASHLGGGTGHLHTAASVSEALAVLGHRVHVALRSPVAAQRLAALARRPLLQAPTVVPPARRLPPARTYAEVLLQEGFDDPDVVSGLVAGWLGLIDATGAERVVAEHCPLALLAANVAGLPAVAIGTGFSVPPCVSPLPDLQPWRPVSRAPVNAELAVGRALREAARRFGGRGPDQVADLFPSEASRLLSFAELDHYGLRSEGGCVGPIEQAARRSTAMPDFPDVPGPRTLVYQHPSYRRLDAIVGSVARTGWPAVVVAPGIDATRAQALETASVRVMDRQVDLDAALAEIDQIVVHGGHGTTVRAVLAGLPCVVAPHYVEQALLGHRLAVQGLAYFDAVGDGPLDLERAFEAQRSPAAREARDRFRRAHEGVSPETNRAALVAWIDSATA